MRDLYLTSPMMSGPDVTDLQRRLETLGWAPGTTDGHFGPVTVEAVRRLQRAARLADDGVVGSLTRAAVDSGIRATPAESSPSGILALAEARKHIGVRENPPGSNRTPFGRWFGVDGVAWCNIFVSYCFFTAAGVLIADGFPGGRAIGVFKGKGCSYVPTTEAWLRSIGAWVDKAMPLPGDIVIYDWQGDGRSDHIGIVSRSADQGAFLAVEGNAGAGEVVEGKRSLSSVRGFGRIRTPPVG